MVSLKVSGLRFFNSGTPSPIFWFPKSAIFGSNKKSTSDPRNENVIWSQRCGARVLITFHLNQNVISVMMMMMMMMMMVGMEVGRVLIAFNLNQKVIRVNRVATTGDQDW